MRSWTAGVVLSNFFRNALNIAGNPFLVAGRPAKIAYYHVRHERCLLRAGLQTQTHGDGAPLLHRRVSLQNRLAVRCALKKRHSEERDDRAHNWPFPEQSAGSDPVQTARCSCDTDV